MKILHSEWKNILSEEFNKSYYINMKKLLEDEYGSFIIYPAKEEIFNALNHTPFSKVKVVIIGQDPYHGNGQAHGLSFSVKPEVSIPRSLKNIFKELQDDIGCFIPNNGYLEKWSNQGILLLNTILTVREGMPNSHKDSGWEQFTDKVISVLNEKEQPIIFILWGKNAQNKEKLINNSKHYIIKSAHPSPFSARKGFFGSKPFSKTNEHLRNLGYTEIDWQIENI